MLTRDTVGQIQGGGEGGKTITLFAVFVLILTSKLLIQSPLLSFNSTIFDNACHNFFLPMGTSYSAYALP